jgi:hypothetical protein
MRYDLAIIGSGSAAFAARGKDASVVMWASPRTVETSPMRRGDGRDAAEVR